MSRTPPLDYVQAAAGWFGRKTEDLGTAERKALEYAARRQAFIEDPIRKLDERASLGDRMADGVAQFGGSSIFISIFGVFLAVWAMLNSEILGKTAFDPYPYIFLNLILSMLAAIQAPIIMMSQNRQATKDRLMATHDYEVNLKAEIEIMALHEKMDALRSQQLAAMVAKQQEQIDLLSQLLQRGAEGAGATAP